MELLQSATQIYFDATFKVVPTFYYQLFTVFVRFADSAFPVFYAVMSRKTNALYKAFEKVEELVSQLKPTCAMADFEEASVSAFQRVFLLYTWYDVFHSRVFHSRVVHSRDFSRPTQANSTSKPSADGGTEKQHA